MLGRNGEGLEISHFLFADDTLFFCEATSSQMTYLSWLLMWFETILCLKINLDKSELIPVGRVSNVMELAAIFGCKVGVLPTTYLGLPQGVAHNLVVVWDGVEERFRKRLSMWKRQYIYERGRLTLIKSTLASLPIYFMSLFWMPRRVRLRLEKIQRDFLWEGGSLEKKPHVVNWDIVCLDKRKGGLRVRRLNSLNKTLLCKWIWRFAKERDALWREVIYGKFGELEEGWCLRK